MTTTVESSTLLAVSVQRWMPGAHWHNWATYLPQFFPDPIAAGRDGLAECRSRHPEQEWRLAETRIIEA